MKRILFIALLFFFAMQNLRAEKPSYWTDKTKFAWGADISAGIDMTGSEMSTLDFSVSAGIRRKCVNFLGVGVQGSTMVSNSCRSFPIYAHLRTNLCEHPTLLFWDLRAGISLNYLHDNCRQTGAYASTGIGINLAQSDKFSTHIILGYTFIEQSPELELGYDYKNVHVATMRIGVSF